MRIFMYCMMTGITLSGAIALGACPPASAAQPLSPSAVRIADADETPAQRDTYRQKANDDMQSWQRKMHDFGERVEVKGKEASKATKDGLNVAWANTQEAGRKLREATAEGWHDAKASYEAASHDLSDRWNKIGAASN